jgi:hypothetical protein
MSRAFRAVYNLLGIVEFAVKVYEWVERKVTKKPKRTVRDILDEQDEVIPLRRVVRPPPLRAKPGGGGPRRGSGG